MASLGLDLKKLKKMYEIFPTNSLKRDKTSFLFNMDQTKVQHNQVLTSATPGTCNMFDYEKKSTNRTFTIPLLCDKTKTIQ